MEARKAKVYISGPITGYSDYLENFGKAETMLKNLGFEVMNPAKLNLIMPKSTSWQGYMDLSLCMLRQCDIIFMLEGNADLCYVPDKEYPVIRREFPLPYDKLPCWSTGALLYMLPDGKDDPPLMLERGGYPSGGSYTHNWFLVEDCDEYIRDKDYDLVKLLVRAIERIYKIGKDERH